MSFNGNGLLPDTLIAHYAENEGMIMPYIRPMVREGGVISYGTEGYAYDPRLAPVLQVYKQNRSGEGPIDPKHVDTSFMMEMRAQPDTNQLIIPPHGFALGHTIEHFSIPEDIEVICIGKSTYARVGLIVNVTPINPGFNGQVVIELSNTTNFPLIVYAHEGICQFLFIKGVRTPGNGYQGRYQDQSGITLPPVLTTVNQSE